MATKTIVLGQKEIKETRKKIELLKALTTGFIVSNGDALAINASNYKYIELICKNYSNTISSDLMFAYDDPLNRSKGILFIGNWNDGIIE